ncbi:hypothetical protein [Vibrio lentus]|uniref:hypothetical protein n=1 Tax=Vibrio lentus TaxID=136468 RepID=UPI000C81E95F|nr:hypothetical protein [Vibrio lentus]MCC4856601.1 hypothetical protein [Vibrio lentus]PML06865.1 hypothetical protein BCT85_23005 [Vibrio lentus]TKF96883.1 hypothetical protein FCV71_10430 [Vibrio lentus]
MKIELVDQFTDFFDDIWVYRSGDKQPCYMYAVNERGHTPIAHNPVLTNSYNYTCTIMLMPENQCNWVLRKSLIGDQAQAYMDNISKLMNTCEQINWKIAPERTLENPLKLSDLLGYPL